VSYNDHARCDQARQMLEESIQLVEAPPVAVPVIREVIGGRR